MDENLVEVPQKKRRKGIYLLPNLFTTGTLFGGFFAIVSSLDGDFSNASLGVLFAMICDGLDGRIARLTNTQSDFGKEYDSLCDMVAFGIASGIVVYAYSLQYLAEYRWLGGKLGWVVAFMYASCTALRLARFNVLTVISGSKKDFFGLPSPAAAAVVVFFVWAMHDWGISGRDVVIPAMLLTAGIAILMVSTFRYNAFKQIKVSERVPFMKMLLMVGLIVLITIDAPRVLFLGFLCYALSGPALWLWGRFRKPAPPPPTPV